jgi:hypothetical protein
VAIFVDIELVSLDAAELPDRFAATFDVIYPGETWCRSVVLVESAAAARLGLEERAIIAAARDALLDLLDVEVAPVSFHLRLTTEGTSILGRATPAGRSPFQGL